MAYLGIQKQIRRNNRNSVLLIILFPILLVFVVVFITRTPALAAGVLVLCALWFIIAWFAQGKLIQMATGSQPLTRKENPRVYNLLENMCMSQGMPMPKLNIIPDDSLNAFASGLSPSGFTITLSRGIIDKLNDDELEGVMAHELSHIINRDVRLMIISIIFVGIFSFIAEMMFRSSFYSGGRRDSKDSGNTLIAIVVTALAYMVSMLLRFAISRKREYMADAGAAEITKRPYALASALRKISADPYIEAVNNRDVAQLFVQNPGARGIKNWFSTHPPIEKRIELLEQYV